MSSELIERFRIIKSKINDRAKLIAVSKFHPHEKIQELYHAGHRDFGENKVQELESKANKLKESCPEIRWHFIGHLQSNKVKQLFSISNLFAIHSLDSEKLFKLFVKEQAMLVRPIKIFAQFNTSGEEQKYGFTHIQPLIKTLKSFEKSDHQKLIFAGLMTIGPIRTNDFDGDTKRCFELLNQFKRQLERDLGLRELELSMGMSADLDHALEAKTNWVRIGSDIFGSR